MERTTTVDTERDAAHLAKAKRLTKTIYALQAIGLFIGLTYVAAVIINYIKLDDVRGTWLDSHFRWQMRTFWFSLLWGAIGIITYLIFIGYLILAVDGLWVIYRIIKGWLYLEDNKEMYALKV